MPAGDMSHLEHLDSVLDDDAAIIRDKETHYKGSWKRRGGPGAFMVLARKWDRMEAFLEERGWDIFGATLADTRKEGVREDIGDLRRYLALVECELRSIEMKAQPGSPPPGDAHLPADDEWKGD